MADTTAPPSNSAINITEQNHSTIHIQNMLKKLKNPPQLLSSAAGKPTCSIFRVPQSMIDSNGKCYEPRVVSIGPYHRSKPHLQMIEEHKWHYLNTLLTRTPHLSLQDYMNCVKNFEKEARDSYSESILMNSDEFNEMMILDGCFLLELFRKVSKIVPFTPNDPLVSMAWVLPFFYRDFIRLENQIPFFILESLFNLTKSQNQNQNQNQNQEQDQEQKQNQDQNQDQDQEIQEQEQDQEQESLSLSSLALSFFNNVMNRTDKDLSRFKTLNAKHLLDLIRSSHLPAREQHAPLKTSKNRETPSHIIRSISKLRRAGIKIRELTEFDSFLDVRFRHGVIEMPMITMDDYMSSFLQNCVAYEQCHVACSMDFTTYATLLDCLMNNYKDVEYLCENNIIENYFGTETEMAEFVNSLGRDVAFAIRECYLKELFEEVNEYYKSSWHVQWATFKYTYFNSPWSFISAIAAFLLLVMSVIQTLYTVLQAYNDNKP